jgi:serine/threonine protein kinase
MGTRRWPLPPDRLPLRLPGPHAHYEVFQLLDKGGQGAVYLGESERQPGKGKAIKFLLQAAWGAAPVLVDAFIAEALLGQELRSHGLGHTLELLDLRPWAADGWPPVALVMQYYACSLKQLLDDCQDGHRFAASQVARWARELAGALADLHDRYRRVHRDVKPGNIMFRLPEGCRYDKPESLLGSEAVLTDFGMTAALGSESPIIVLRDRWKDPAFYPEIPSSPPAEGAASGPESTIDLLPPPDRRQRCVAAMDVHSFGLVLRALAEVTEGDTKWLQDVAADCTQPDPEKRPRAAQLFLRLSPDWDEQVRLIRAAWQQPEEHLHFEGRTFITRDEFEPFARGCGDRGGVFVIQGPAGVGKTALLTNWSQQVGQPFGFYFRYRDNRTRAGAMPRAIAEQLCHRFRCEFREPASERDWTAALERLCAEVARLPEAPQRLLLFVDGLDEADDPTEAVGFIPKALPRGVFVVASTRPAAQGKDHLAVLRAAGARVYTLVADGAQNLADLSTYLRKQLHGRVSAAEADTLAQNAGGIFLLARLLVEAIHGKQRSVAEALRQSQNWADLDPSQRLIAYYRESWERICATDDAEALSVFAGLMAAVFTWVSEEQLERILSWYEHEVLRRTARLWTPFRLRAVLRGLSWFLERRGAPGDPKGSFYQIRHQSVRDYLLSAEGPVPPRGVEELHDAVGSYYQARANQLGWSRIDPYGRFFAVRHLLNGAADELLHQAAQLLTSPEYLQATLGDEPVEEGR